MEIDMNYTANAHDIVRAEVAIAALLRQRKADVKARDMMAEYLAFPRAEAQAEAPSQAEVPPFNPANGAVAWIEGGRQIWYALPRVKVVVRKHRVARIEMDYDRFGIAD